MARLRKFNQYFYNTSHGYFKIVTYRQFDPDQFRIEYYRRKFFFFWEDRGSETFYNMFDATQALKNMKIRFEKLGKLVKQKTSRE